MGKNEHYGSMSRRKFNALLTIGAFSVPAVAAEKVKSGSSKGGEGKGPGKLDHRNERPGMTYKKLGRTNFMSSRLVFGCGAALTGGKAVRLLDRALEAGINHYDVGSNIVYKGSERSLAPFLKANRGEIWVTSKAPLFMKSEPGGSVTVEQARKAAGIWTKLLNASLKDLKAEYIDAYSIMGVDNPEAVKSEEVYKAFLSAKKAGKVGHFGLSCHKNAERVLKAAIKTGWYEFAMIGITPAGWYDWTTKSLEKGTPPMTRLQPLLKQARKAGIGLIGMKAVRYLAPMAALGKGDPAAFDRVYDEEFKKLPLNPFQRSFAYVLKHGLDVVNADMQNFKHLEEDIAAATCDV